MRDVYSMNKSLSANAAGISFEKERVYVQVDVFVTATSRVLAESVARHLRAVSTWSLKSAAPLLGLLCSIGKRGLGFLRQ